MGDIKLESISLELQFDGEGEVEKVLYDCGCGDGIFVDYSKSILTLVSAHLAHLKEDHHIEPRRRCSYAVQTAQEPLRCVLELHGDSVKHLFEL